MSSGVSEEGKEKCESMAHINKMWNVTRQQKDGDVTQKITARRKIIEEYK